MDLQPAARPLPRGRHSRSAGWRTPTGLVWRVQGVGAAAHGQAWACVCTGMCMCAAVSLPFSMCVQVCAHGCVCTSVCFSSQLRAHGRASVPIHTRACASICAVCATSVCTHASVGFFTSVGLLFTHVCAGENMCVHGHVCARMRLETHPGRVQGRLWGEGWGLCPKRSPCFRGDSRNFLELRAPEVRQHSLPGLAVLVTDGQCPCGRHASFLGCEGSKSTAHKPCSQAHKPGWQLLPPDQARLCMATAPRHRGPPALELGRQDPSVGPAGQVHLLWAEGPW